MSKRSEQADKGLKGTEKHPLAILPAGINQLSAISPNCAKRYAHTRS